jgi:hypothetical protein
VNIIRSIKKNLLENAKQGVSAAEKDGRRKFIRNLGIGIAGAAVASPVISAQSGKSNDNFSGSWQEDDKWKWNQSGTKKWADIQDKEHVSVDGHGHYDIHSKIAHFHTDVAEHEHDRYVTLDSQGYIDIGGLSFDDGTMQSTAFPSPIANTNKLLYSDGINATWEDADSFAGSSVIYSGSPPSDPKKSPLWFDTTNKQLKFYDGEKWVEIYSESRAIEARGGSVSTSGGFTIHTFYDSNSVSDFTVTDGEGYLEILAWGAGGAASGRHGSVAGGGGGCVKVIKMPIKKNESITIGVGSGGERAAGHCYRYGGTSGGKNPLGRGNGGNGGGAGPGGCSVAGSSGGAATILEFNGSDIVIAAGGGGAGGAESCGGPGAGGAAGKNGDNCYAHQWRSNSYGAGGTAGGMSGTNGGNKDTASGDQSGSGGGGGGYRGGNHGNDVHYDCWGQPGGGGGTSNHSGLGSGTVYNGSGKTPGNSGSRPGSYGDGGYDSNGRGGYVIIKYLTDGE